MQDDTHTQTFRKHAYNVDAWCTCPYIQWFPALFCRDLSYCASLSIALAMQTLSVSHVADLIHHMLHHTTRPRTLRVEWTTVYMLILQSTAVITPYTHSSRFTEHARCRVPERCAHRTWFYANACTLLANQQLQFLYMLSCTPQCYLSCSHSISTLKLISRPLDLSGYSCTQEYHSG